MIAIIVYYSAIYVLLIFVEYSGPPNISEYIYMYIMYFILV